MKCSQCGGELTAGNPECPNCRHVTSDVKVLSRRERDSFAGVTFDGEEPRETENSGRYRNEQNGSRIYVRQVSLGGGSGGFLSKLIWGGVLALIALLTLLFLAALPIVIMVLSFIGAIFYYFFRR